MQAPGFWDDQERAAKVSAEHSVVTRRLEGFRELESDVDDLDALEEMAAEDEGIASELQEQRSLDRVEAGRARGGAPVQRRVRRRRRRRDRQRRRRRHGLAGLGRDAAAHGDALGRVARDEGRAQGGLGGGGGRHQVRDLHRPRRERLRPLQRREGRAPAGADIALRRPVASPHRLRRRRGGAAARRRHERRDRARRPADRHLPRLGRRRPARQQDRLGGAHHPQAVGDRGAVPERALAVGQQGRPR